MTEPAASVTPPAGARPYTRLQIRLHWLVVALIALQYVINADIRQAFRLRLLDQMPVWPPETLAKLHLASGTLILLLMLWRFFLRRSRDVSPVPPPQIPGWLHLLATLGHIGIYVTVLGVTVTGLLAWGLASPLAGTLHEIGRLVLLVLILLHVAGAFVEHFPLRNPVLHHITTRPDEEGED